MTLTQVPSATELSPQVAWSQRVRKVGGFIQLAFAAFSLVRGGLSITGITGPVLAAAGIVVSIVVLGYAIRVTAGIGGRPTSAAAKRIERSVSIATVIELVASFAFPVIVIATGHGRLGPAVDRHHHRAAAAVARPPGRHSPIPPGRLGLDRCAVHPRRSHVGLHSGRHHRPRSRRPVARNGDGGFHDLSTLRAHPGSDTVEHHRRRSNV